jgi:predicted porin
MKIKIKNTFVVALTVTALSPVSSFGQSSVTLFGAIDTNIRYISYSGRGAATSMGSFGGYPSFIGMMGSEDLGGGMQAIFRIDAGFVPSTGQSAEGAWNLPFFDRSSWVGLSGRFGVLHFGRDWSPTYNNVWPYDPSWNLGVGDQLHLSNIASKAIVPGYDWTANSITYYLPSDLGGLTGSFQVAPRGDGKTCDGNPVCTSTVGSYVGGKIGYQRGPLEAAVALGQTGISYNTWSSSPSGKWTQANIGVIYDLRVIKLSAMINTERFIDLRENRGSVAVTVPIGVDSAWASAGGTRTNAAAQAAGLYGAYAFALGYTHLLSKRTAVYAAAAYLKNSGRGTFSVEDVNSYTTNTLPGGGTTGIELGIRTVF